MSTKPSKIHPETRNINVFENLSLASGERVVVKEGSHLFDHKHDNVSSQLKEALSRITSSGRPFIEEELTFDDPIGEAICVGTTDQDVIVYARRPKRAGLTRFVKNRKPESCNQMIVVLKYDEQAGVYVVITAFVGFKGKEPWDRFATDSDKLFWTNHALVWGSQEVEPGTETSECPW